jgi:hypothetical protein
MSIMNSYYEFVDRSRIFRRVMLYCTLGQALYCVWWATGYADKLLVAGDLKFDAGVIIGAILTPSLAFAGKTFQWYNDGRVQNGDK